MNQYVSFQEVRLDVRVRFVKMRKDLLFFLVINTLVDLAYVAIDPRIRYG